MSFSRRRHSPWLSVTLHLRGRQPRDGCGHRGWQAIHCWPWRPGGDVWLWRASILHRDQATGLRARRAGLRRAEQRRAQDQLPGDHRGLASDEWWPRGLASWPHCYLLKIFTNIRLDEITFPQHGDLSSSSRLTLSSLKPGTEGMRSPDNQLTTFAHVLSAPPTRVIMSWSRHRAPFVTFFEIFQFLF